MNEIREQPCHTDQILTDAGLRGVRHISWQSQQLQVREAIATLQSIIKQFGVSKDGTGMLKELQALDARMTQQAIEWITQVGWQPHKDYAITILIEEVDA